jgi:hypothetical protein
MAEKVREARRKLFESAAFRDEVAERLNFGNSMVSNAVAALLQPGSIPCTNLHIAGALAVDGARILIADRRRNLLFAAAAARLLRTSGRRRRGHRSGPPVRHITSGNATDFDYTRLASLK